MTIEMDERAGRVVGARVRMRGTVMGLRLVLEEVVTEREPPFRKVWEIVEARLLVIGQYRLGFDLSPQGDATKLRVFIDYSLPQKGAGRWLGRLFGGAYASWCTRRMTRDASRYFMNAPA